MVSEDWTLGEFGDERLTKRGVCFSRGWSHRASICLRRLAGGRRSGIVGFSRFLANPRVTVEALLDGWGAELSEACAGRHVLAIQDTSEINFTTTKQRNRGLGEIGRGVGRGVLLHAMLGLDAETGAIWGWLRGGCGRVTAGSQSVIRTGPCPRRSRSGG
jgi:hypothetical protein